VSLAAPPMPKGRLVAAATHEYHVTTLGTGRPTVFLHGGGPGCTGWSDFGPVAHLFATDRQCHLVDLLQYGRSAKPIISGPMWDYHADSMVELLDALEIERADFVCNSWGGTIALDLAGRHPERARSLVITGSMPVVRGVFGGLPEGGRRGRNARDRYYGGEGPTWEKMRALIARLEWYDAAKIPDETVTMRYEQSLDPEERALAGFTDDPRGDRQDLSEHLRNMRCPVLFFWGMYDGFLTPEYPLMLARMVPRGNLYVMDHASHHPQEERPAEFHRVVSSFLDMEHDPA
jgi:2-hydroxy-6-oxonona-2,4-dienedioate hydrolase